MAPIGASLCLFSYDICPSKKFGFEKVSEAVQVEAHAWPVRELLTGDQPRTVRRSEAEDTSRKIYDTGL
jgi:hypothetical protein